MKTLQKFSAENVDRSRHMSVEQILNFLEDFRLLSAATQATEPTRLISIKMPPALLRVFQAKCETSGVKYQTQIKNLMKAWLLG